MVDLSKKKNLKIVERTFREKSEIYFYILEIQVTSSLA